jgi:hypothetical protein
MNWVHKPNVVVLQVPDAVEAVEYPHRPAVFVEQMVFDLLREAVELLLDVRPEVPVQPVGDTLMRRSAA